MVGNEQEALPLGRPGAPHPPRRTAARRDPRALPLARSGSHHVRAHDARPRPLVDLRRPARQRHPRRPPGAPRRTRPRPRQPSPHPRHQPGNAIARNPAPHPRRRREPGAPEPRRRRARSAQVWVLYAEGPVPRNATSEARGPGRRAGDSVDDQGLHGEGDTVREPLSNNKNVEIPGRSWGKPGGFKR